MEKKILFFFYFILFNKYAELLQYIGYKKKEIK